MKVTAVRRSTLSLSFLRLFYCLTMSCFSSTSLCGVEGDTAALPWSAIAGWREGRRTQGNWLTSAECCVHACSIAQPPFHLWFPGRFPLSSLGSLVGIKRPRRSRRRQQNPMPWIPFSIEQVATVNGLHTVPPGRLEPRRLPLLLPTQSPPTPLLTKNYGPTA